MEVSKTFWREKSERLGDPYLTAGDRAYAVGAQHGGFPDLGWHVPGEMGGVWAPPLKLLDGFWLRIDGHWLVTADCFAAGQLETRHEYSLEGGLRVVRTQFAPDGEPAIVVRFELLAAEARTLQVAFLARSDLQRVWSPQRGNTRRARDVATYLEDARAWLVTGTDGDCVLVGARSHLPTRRDAGPDLWGPEVTRGEGTSVVLEYELEPAPKRPAVLEFVLCGGIDGQSEAAAVLQRVRARAGELLARKQVRSDYLQSLSDLEVDDPSITRAWDWLKWNIDWLVLEVPGVGRGITAGAPDYLWWFGCDSAYAALGCLALGRHDVAAATLDLIRAQSAAVNGGTGRVLHECTTAGEVVHPGCVQETSHFVEAVWEVFSWTGDREFLARQYEFCRAGVFDWTLGRCCRDGELLPYGYGITETEGLDLQCLDSAVHLVQALRALAGMAEVLDDDETAATCLRLADTAWNQLDAAFWLEDEGLYADMLGTPRQMVGRIEAWIAAVEAREFTLGRRPEVLAALNELLRAAETEREPDRRRGWPLRYWIVITPLEAGLASPERARRTLDRTRGPEFVGAHGMYLSGVDHTHTMSVNTGVLAVAELRYGRAGDALQRLRVMTDTLDLHMPGAISEMLPDYGCCVQAWSSFAVAWPVVAHMFGLQPRADRRELELQPCFPAEWDRATLSHVRIGEARFDFEWDGGSVHVLCDDARWSVTSATVPLVVEHAHVSTPRGR